MNVTGRIAEVRKLTDDARASGSRVGFVPTMGALHEGHRSLVRRARAETGFVVVSVFVNPAQFDQAADLDAYPRTIDDDLEVCAAEGADLVFHPDPEEIYPRPPLTQVRVSGLTDRMEGAFRPGHFDGVTLVVTKLFNIVGACAAYFGQKDAQQLRVVRRMAADLDMPVEVVACPTVRDADGLALSSRNARLDSADRERALALVRAFAELRRLFETGQRSGPALQRAGLAVLEDCGVDKVDYLEVVHPETLEPLPSIEDAALVCGAVHVGGVRLIDNTTIGSPEEE